MNIKISLTKALNADYLGASVGDIVEMPFEEYLRGVVAAEMGNSHREACRAQAVVSRTFAWLYAKESKPISDSSLSAQAFSAVRMNDPSYENAHLAVKDTEGVTLCFGGKPLSPCSFSKSNGGKTTSSESRWGGYRPYLIEQSDPWDYAVTHGKKSGHGVGMSQLGARYAAAAGRSYQEILSFYYPGAVLCKEGSPMASVKASDLVSLFNTMASEKWKYVAGAHKQGEVDCSGAFYYAYKKLGGYMYHGSNTMWRKYTAEKGKIGEIDLLPGMAVFKCRAWSSAHSSNGWYETEPGDVYHVGMYVGNGNVVEAQGKKTGVVITKLETWHLAARLKDTVYDLDEQQSAAEPQTQFASRMGVVAITSGWLNLRRSMDASSERMGKLYNGDAVTIVGEQGDWYQLLYNGKPVYAKRNYIALVDEGRKQYTLSIVVLGEDERDRMTAQLKSCGYQPAISEGGAAA